MSTSLVIRSRKVISLILLLLLSACGGGGGGGGGGGLSISLSPSNLSATVYEGEGRAFLVDGHARGTVSGTVYILIEDPQGLTDGNIPFMQLGVRDYRATIVPRTTLTPGRYTGQIRIRVCGDFSCNNTYDSVTLPYDITVVARPTLQSVNPTSVIVGSGAIEVLVTGATFTPSSVGRLDGQARSTRFISPTQLGITLTANDTAATGTHSIDVLGQTEAGAVATTAASFQVLNPVPVLSSFSPTGATFGGAAFGLQVTGSNFVSGTVVRWNGSNRETQVISSTQIVVQILESDLDTGGTASITAFNPDPGGGTSEAKTFAVNSPVPTLSLITPSQLASKDAPTSETLQLTGTNFTRFSVALWNGSPRQTTYLSPTQLLVFVPASDVADGTTAQVAVLNPTPAGGTSAAVALPISNPVPVLERIHATRSSAGCGDFTLLAVGAHFRPSTQVLWNGSPRPTTRVSSTMLRAQIMAADVENAGTAHVTVSSPTPGGGVGEKTAEFEITSDQVPTTAAVAYQISPSHAGYATTRCPINVPANAEPLWTFDSGEPMTYALIADGRVFVTGKMTQRITALNAQTGVKLWGPTNADITAPSYDNGTLFASGYERFFTKQNFMALDPATGTVKWQVDTDDFPQPYGSVALDGRVIFSTSDQIEVRSQDDGEILWTNYHPGGGGMVAADANAIYATGPCTTRAYELDDGAWKWNRNIGCTGGGGATPSVTEGLVYSVRDVPGGITYDRLDADTGVANASPVISSVLPARSPRHEIRIRDRALSGTVIDSGTTWTVTEEDAPIGSGFSSPILVNDTVFILRGDGQLYVHDADSGLLLTSFNVGDTAPGSVNIPRIDSGLAVGEGLLVVPTEQGIAAYRIAEPGD